MRGKVGGGLCADRLAGITPAYAGKRHLLHLLCRESQDHPRVCGEKSIETDRQEWGLGSPPRMRGKGKNDAKATVFAGITPAYAGKSSRRLAYSLRIRDHPRVCGEKSCKQRLTNCKQGSPPRMRGKGIFSLIFVHLIRITPAYAGKRLKRSHSIGHFSCILRLFHSVLHRASASGGSRAGPCAPPCLPAQNAVPV